MWFTREGLKILLEALFTNPRLSGHLKLGHQIALRHSTDVLITLLEVYNTLNLGEVCFDLVATDRRGGVTYMRFDIFGTKAVSDKALSEIKAEIASYGLKKVP